MTITESSSSNHFAFADARRGTRHVFVRGLEVDTVVGIYEHEKRKAQRLIISVDLHVVEDSQAHNDKLENVVCYEQVVRNIQKLCSMGHVNLIETLAERIAENCLSDRRVLTARIRIEKPDIMPECASVGIEIERTQI